MKLYFCAVPKNLESKSGSMISKRNLKKSPNEQERWIQTKFGISKLKLNKTGNLSLFSNVREIDIFYIIVLLCYKSSMVKIRI